MIIHWNELFVSCGIKWNPLTPPPPCSLACATFEVGGGPMKTKMLCPPPPPPPPWSGSDQIDAHATPLFQTELIHLVNFVEVNLFLIIKKQWFAHECGVFTFTSKLKLCTFHGVMFAHLWLIYFSFTDLHIWGRRVCTNVVCTFEGEMFPQMWLFAHFTGPQTVIGNKRNTDSMCFHKTPYERRFLTQFFTHRS